MITIFTKRCFGKFQMYPYMYWFMLVKKLQNCSYQFSVEFKTSVLPMSLLARPLLGVLFNRDKYEANALARLSIKALIFVREV